MQISGGYTAGFLQLQTWGHIIWIKRQDSKMWYADAHLRLGRGGGSGELLRFILDYVAKSLNMTGPLPSKWVSVYKIDIVWELKSSRIEKKLYVHVGITWSVSKSTNAKFIVLIVINVCITHNVSEALHFARASYGYRTSTHAGLATEFAYYTHYNYSLIYQINVRLHNPITCTNTFICWLWCQRF